MRGTSIWKITTPMLALLVWSAVCSGDTLFKDKTPLAIGHGKKLGEKLHWTDCDGKNPKDYDAPPYWTDASANCNLTADSFGLEISSTSHAKSVWASDGWTKATVQDSTFLKKLFPNAKIGDSMMVFKGADSIKFNYDGKVQELKTATLPAKKDIY